MNSKRFKRARSVSPIGKHSAQQEVRRPYIPAQCGQFVCEHIIAKHGILDLFESDRIWEEIKLEVMKRFNLVVEPNMWKRIWIEYLDRSYETILNVRWSGATLPKILRDDPTPVKHLKANIRFMAYQRAHIAATAPLSIQIYECLNSSISTSPPSRSSSSSVSSCISKLSLGRVMDISPSLVLTTKTSNDDGSDSHSRVFSDNEQMVCTTLFANMTFYLLRVDDILKQTERWRIEFLLRIHGGKCIPMETQITQDTLILATDETPIKLLKLKTWYKAKVYRTALIMESIEERRLDAKLLKKFEWHTPYIPNFTKEAGLEHMVSSDDSDSDNEG